MKTRVILLLAAILGFNAASCQDAERRRELAILNEWRAGECVSRESVAEFGIDNCFTAQEIDDAVFGRIEGRSYGSGCTIPLSELRYLKVLHCDLDNNTVLGEMICNRAISDDLLEIFRTLFDAGYPIGRMVLVDEYDADDERSMSANNSSCFNFRFISGTARLSNHSSGMAVDINPLYNPYVRTSGGRTTVEPAAAAPYTDREADFPCKIDENDLCYREFRRHGFEWGGHWRSSKDYQHFEKRTEE